MQAWELQTGDEWHDADDNLMWTILWGPWEWDRSRVAFRIQTAYDGGETERVFEGDREMTGIVRPVPPEV